MPIKKKELKDLSLERLRDMQKEFKDVHLLLIDEKSMVGMYTLYMIDKRLREIKPENATKPFGGVSVILMGDFAQLAPVKDQPLYSKSNKITQCQMTGRLLFKKFRKTMIFDQQMRQIGEDQKQYNKLLDRVANAETTLDDWYLLKTRELTGDGIIPPDQQEEIWKNGRKICALNANMVEYNKQRIRALDAPIAKIKSENKPTTVEQFSLKASQAQNLPPIVWLAKGSKVRLTMNIFKKAGLTNGAVGTVVGIIYEENCKPQDLPSMIIVHFPDYIGKMSYKGMDGCWPIVPVARDWYDPIRRKRRWRRMLPVMESYASTIHTCQGQSISGPVIIDLQAPKEFADGLIFTSLSRIKKFSQLSFTKVPDFTWFKNMKKRQSIRDRLAHEKKEREEDANFDANSD